MTGVENTDGKFEQYVRILEKKDRIKGLDYWKGLLDGYDTKSAIPSYGKVTAEDRAMPLYDIREDVISRLRKICSEEDVTLSNALELAWGLTLQTYSRQEDAVFLKVVSGRDNVSEDMSKVMGAFINSVPVRVRQGKDMTVRQMLHSMQKQSAESNEFDYCSLSEILKLTPLGNNLFQSIITFQNFIESNGTSANADNPLGIKPAFIKEENVNEVAATFLLSDDKLSIDLKYDKTLFSARQMKGVLDLFATILENMAMNPEKAVNNLARTASREEAISFCQGITLPYNAGETFVDMVLSQAGLQPSATAVVDATGSISYGELSESSLRLGSWLRRQGVAEGDFVCIMLPRIKEFVVSVLAVQRIGAAYVPVDMDYPEDRRRFMIEDSGAKVVIDEETLRTALSSDTAEEPSLNLSRPDGRAYMIYTSGTTGKPKGAVILHKGLRAFIAWNNSMLHQGPDTRHLVHASFSFDASIFDMLCPLAVGSQVHILSETLRRDLDGIASYIRDNRITGMLVTTQVGMALLNGFDLPLEYMMLGGEKMLPVRKTGVRVINAYGPTEFTAASTTYEVRGDETDIPIGRPVPNSTGYVCDRYGNILPQGVAGELVMEGVQLGGGYWNREEQTREKFSGGRYRTGDLVRYDENGNLLYLGRIDTQVKLRGFRIELGEIESRAASHPLVVQVAAEVKSAGGVQTLVLYYTVSGQLSPEALKTYVSETLTDYMVPDVFMQLDEMPMTPGGKIDRKALPVPERTVSVDWLDSVGKSAVTQGSSRKNPFSKR